MVQDLSPREREVAELVSEGNTTKEIALDLGISQGRVKDCIANACRKQGLQGRTQLAVWFEQEKEKGA